MSIVVGYEINQGLAHALNFKGTPLEHPAVMMKTEILRSFKYSENTSMNEDIDLKKPFSKYS